ncbi:hypothetical protein HMPREF0185_00449 [Brevundimonas diminuta 470-4]|nr:hypothetical protein HMPREF0185_00449 [Brevundimonas diminuta 470-4]
MAGQRDRPEKQLRLADVLRLDSALRAQPGRRDGVRRRRPGPFATRAVPGCGWIEAPRY